MRIIAGKYKGKVLRTFEADNIRPTSDMVKEAIWSKLQLYFPESVVLDLFGGTGNFGFEAFIAYFIFVVGIPVCISCICIV